MKSEKASTPSSKRAYDSSGRQEQARATRRRIRAAAADLFVEQGYAATSIGAIAEAAGVAPQTIYGAFGSKAKLLGEVIEVALAGDDEPIAVNDRPESRRVLETETAAEAAAAMAAAVRAIFERTAALLAVGDVAATSDPEMAGMVRGGSLARLQDMAASVDGLIDRGFVRKGLDRDDVVDAVWALTAPPVYLAFVRDREWSPDQYEDWLRGALGLVIG